MSVHKRVQYAQIEEGVFAGTHGPVVGAVAYTQLRAHETVLALICRLLLEKKHYKSREMTSFEQLGTDMDLTPIHTTEPT